MLPQISASMLSCVRETSGSSLADSHSIQFSPAILYNPNAIAINVRQRTLGALNLSLTFSRTNNNVSLQQIPQFNGTMIYRIY